MTDASQIIPHRVSAEHASALHGAIVIILDVDLTLIRVPRSRVPRTIRLGGFVRASSTIAELF